MKLTVFGATGGTGEQLVRQALAAGHDVIAVVRHPEAVTITGPNLTVIAGDVVDPSWPGTGLEGVSAVLSALGSRPFQHTTVYSQGTPAILAAMTRAGVSRLVGVSASPLVPEASKSLLERRVVHPLLGLFFGDSYADMRKMETVLADSQVDWTLFRPPRLTNGPHTGRYRTAVGARLPRARSISRADLADAMLAAIDDPAVYRQAVSIAK
jgi:putative NADH-flavin reductase